MLCFDADDAGEKFARNFYMNHPELKVVRDLPDPQYKDWNEQLLAEREGLSVKDKGLSEDTETHRTFRR
ncbi:MAG: toprim domain-containing protein [Bacteroidales bacterium]|nr:toprim domain-containing protein [Bacteroidales bacterium]